MVGYSDTAEGADHAFITVPDGMGMRDLGTLGGGLFPYASEINDAGQVAIYVCPAGFPPPCFHYRPKWQRHDGSQFPG